MMSPAPSSKVYDVAGLKIASPVELAARIGTGHPDITYVPGDNRPVGSEPPSESIVAERIVQGRRFYTFARTGDLVVARFHGFVDFEMDLLKRRIVSYAEPGSNTDIIPILLTGTIAAYLLSIGGRLVTHASAVEDRQGRAIAFVGPSGRGKTTVAAVCCSEGYRLVTDDVLPLAVAGGQVSCRPAGIELRVRQKAAALADYFEESQRGETADNRLALSPRRTTRDLLPIRAFVLPLPDREHDAVRVERLSLPDATLHLSAFQRIEGWKDRDEIRGQFGAIAEVVATVPVLRMWLPWGPPFPANLADQIMTSIQESESSGQFAA